MWTNTARARSMQLVSVKCDECHKARVKVPAIRAGQPNYCAPCKAEIKRRRNLALYYAKREEILQYKHDKRLHMRSPVRPAREQHNYSQALRLLHDAGDFMRGAVLPLYVWREMAAYGDLAGAEFEDDQGNRWAADERTVKASGPADAQKGRP